MRLLVVEDDALIAAGVRDALRQADYEVDLLHEGRQVADVVADGLHDLLLLDLGLPDTDGLALVRQLREAGATLPILILTARDGLQDRVDGLHEGADDYLTKPFQLPELLARVHALLRRSRSASTSRLSIGPLQLNLATHETLLDGQPLALTGREWHLLRLLALEAPRVVPKRKLADSLSRWDKEVTDNAVEIYISRLRAKLSTAALQLRTVRGIGYRLEV
ncbi:MULTISPECIES: response regulator [Roseateles]|uniref:Response regulator transcription factor n=1 Tax=Pelomonas caseinilytica TaxID=2906763 RepID=A0ABS8XJA3_9BURK|nr:MULTISPECIES: response regulator transcription factor [unclassified Roseateles]MCE4539632.1 response regulator transcription factor [Pelomonas sp. P7]HEV6964877.1 response regulator transcription factor [Roseateles sp.]